MQKIYKCVCGFSAKTPTGLGVHIAHGNRRAKGEHYNANAPKDAASDLPNGLLSPSETEYFNLSLAALRTEREKAARRVESLDAAITKQKEVIAAFEQ